MSVNDKFVGHGPRRMGKGVSALNEYGLLEEVDGLLFIEWSKANEFTKGINFPSHMLFYKTLYAVYNLFGDKNTCGNN